MQLSRNSQFSLILVPGGLLREILDKVDIKNLKKAPTNWWKTYSWGDHSYRYYSGRWWNPKGNHKSRFNSRKRATKRSNRIGCFESFRYRFGRWRTDACYHLPTENGWLKTRRWNARGQIFVSRRRFYDGRPFFQQNYIYKKTRWNFKGKII